MFKSKYGWDDLKELYIDQQLSGIEIAKIKKCSYSAVYLALNKRGIVRNLSLALKIGYKYKRCRQKQRQRIRAGYTLIYQPEHPNATNDGYIGEHRLVIEQKVGRYLSIREFVHHISGIKNDNRP